MPETPPQKSPQKSRQSLAAHGKPLKGKPVKPKPVESEPVKPGPARGGSGLGLAGRVALIGCAAAIVATLAQWVLTPLMAMNEVSAYRAAVVRDGAHTLAASLSVLGLTDPSTRIEAHAQAVAMTQPQGQALVLDLDGRLVGQGGVDAPLPSADELKRIEAAPGQPLRMGRRFYAAQSVIEEGAPTGWVVFSFQPRTVSELWFGIVWRNALVLVLALLVIAPFLLPLARRALSPVTQLEARIRSRATADKSRLSDSVDDAMLKPLIAAIDDLHERSQAATARALKMAFADPVTRLPNRLRFMSKLEAAVDRGRGGPVFLAVFDLNGFRKINMTLGPRLADDVLAHVAQRLRACAAELAPGAMFIGRLGADQFGVIAPGATREGLSAFLSAAQTAIAEPILIEGQPVVATGVFGAALSPDDAQTAADLLKQAEIALKEAKASSGVRLAAFFDPRLLEKQRMQSRLEAELREGLDRGEFVAVFQPKVRLDTGELAGAEALARWRRPDGSVVSPGVFVPLAEEIGLISKLGNCVLRDACFAAAEWKRRGAAQCVAVNVSPHQFNDADFVDQVWRALDDSGLDPSLLELEITESAAVSEPERVARVMWPLRSRGVRLAIDDFGTGHSNFTSITRLPFDVFKIDQQFIRALTTDPHAPAIVEMILAMAEALNQETVAEGVETREQAEFLLRRNCTIGQGYFYSPPLPAAEFNAFVRSWRPRPADRFAA